MGQRRKKQQGGFPPILAAHAALKSLKPITLIDSGLQALGLRDKVRNKLNSSTIGSLLVKAADFGKNRLGYGEQVKTKKASKKKGPGRPRKVGRPKKK